MKLFRMIATAVISAAATAPLQAQLVYSSGNNVSWSNNLAFQASYSCQTAGYFTSGSCTAFSDYVRLQQGSAYADIRFNALNGPFTYVNQNAPRSLFGYISVTTGGTGQFVLPTLNGPSYFFQMFVRQSDPDNPAMSGQLFLAQFLDAGNNQFMFGTKEGATTYYIRSVPPYYALLDNLRADSKLNAVNGATVNLSGIAVLVPEPSTLALTSSALFGVALLARRRRRRA